MKVFKKRKQDTANAPLRGMSPQNVPNKRAKNCLIQCTTSGNLAKFSLSHLALYVKAFPRVMRSLSSRTPDTSSPSSSSLTTLFFGMIDANRALSPFIFFAFFLLCFLSSLQLLTKREPLTSAVCAIIMFIILFCIIKSINEQM